MPLPPLRADHACPALLSSIISWTASSGRGWRDRPAAGLVGGFRELPRQVKILTVVAFIVAIGFGIQPPAIPVFASEQIQAAKKGLPSLSAGGGVDA